MNDELVGVYRLNARDLFVCFPRGKIKIQISRWFTYNTFMGRFFFLACRQILFKEGLIKTVLSPFLACDSHGGTGDRLLAGFVSGLKIICSLHVRQNAV